MRMSARLNEAFGVELPLRTLFEAPVLADLAERIDIFQWERTSRQSLNDEASSVEEEWVL
ncbi:acyl carrier protein [Bradyrhizobium liaoningense]|nr:acyl carrier protein [Bradyrhizobium liaoningense]